MFLTGLWGSPVMEASSNLFQISYTIYSVHLNLAVDEVKYYSAFSVEAEKTILFSYLPSQSFFLYIRQLQTVQPALSHRFYFLHNSLFCLCLLLLVWISLEVPQAEHIIPLCINWTRRIVWQDLWVKVLFIHTIFMIFFQHQITLHSSY